MNSSEPLEATIENKSALCRAYMPFIGGGGVFVPTERRFELGDNVTVALSLFDSGQPAAVHGRVVWITPERAQYRRVAGVGVQIDGNDALRQRLEDLLAGISGGDEPTHTF